MKRHLLAALGVLLLCTPLFAQQTTGTITGRVLDPQGAAIPGATITAKSAATGFARTDVSDGAGLYRLAALPVGAYDVTVQLQGFATTAKEDIQVNVAQTLALDFDLKVAAVAETVNVTSATPLINTAVSSVGEVVDLQRIQNLPLNGRQFANLAATIPGVGLTFFSDPTKTANYAPQINGGNGRNISYLIDGGDNNDDTVGGLLQPFPLEAIQEFNFQTQRFKAEYGRSDGGVMNVVTKSGTNQYQGSFFELFRNKAMNALTETEKLTALTAGTSPVKGDYLRNQFGGSLGGPIVQDKVHFFFAVERTQQDKTQGMSTTVLALYPTLTGALPVNTRDTLGSGKVAANLTSAQYLTVRYGYDKSTAPDNVSAVHTPDSWGEAANTFHSINVNHNWVLGGSKLNEFIFQASYFLNATTADSVDPSISFPNGVVTGTDLNAPQSTDQHKYQFRDDFSWHATGHGGLGHDFKAGVNFINEPYLSLNLGSAKGVPQYILLNNALTSPVRIIQLKDGNGNVDIPTKQYGLYFQDDWRVSNRLTVNAGVRYDLVTGLNFDQSKNPNFVLVQAAAKAGVFNSLAAPVAAVMNDFALSPQSDRNNIQPRIGAVYDVKGTGKDVVRGGWGVYTDFGYTNSNVLFAALDATGNRYGFTFAAQNNAGLKNLDGTFYQPGQSLTTLNSPNLTSVPLQGYWVDPRLQMPYQMQANLGWSHELSSSTVVSVDYVNSLGRDLNYKPRLNQLVAGSTTLRRISALLTSPLSPNTSSDRPALSVGRSTYNAMILELRRRMTAGIDFSASYTLSSSISNIGGASDELNSANIQDPNNPFDAPVQMGPDAATDARHRVNISAVFQLPFGIQAAPFFLYRSALPAQLIDGRDLNKDGDVFDIPTTAYAVDSVNAATGTATIKTLGACATVNCGRGSPQSQLNLRVSKVFHAGGRMNVEAIGEVYNLFNALNPATANLAVNTSAGAANPSLLQPQSYSGDNGRPEQRLGQIGIRFTF